MRVPEYLPSVAAIKCIVRPKEEVNKPQKMLLRVSQKASGTVANAATAITHPGLQESLLQLSKTLKKGL